MVAACICSTERTGGKALDEPGLIERAQHGDHVAFEVLVTRYQQLAFRAAYLVVGEADEAQDAAQEAFVKAFLALARFRTAAPFKPWLLRIVINEARNRRTAASRRARLAIRSEHAAPAATEASPEAMLLDHERRIELLSVLDDLREDDRTAITYRYFLDLNEGEMAEALGIARGTVKSRLSRALDRLRERLAAGVGLSELEGRDG